MTPAIVEVVHVAQETSWLPWAVQYFFLIGLSAGAFLLSLPGILLRRPGWETLSRRALLMALVCGLTAPVALLSDLHQPGRFLNFYIHANASSWMAWGAFFIPLYLGGLLLYAWLALRPALAVLGREGGAGASWYRKLAYGGHDSRGALMVAAAVAGLGMLLVMTYTGMEVMVVRARPLWNSPLLPLLFAITALAGAVGSLQVLERFMGASDAAAMGRLNRLMVACQMALLAAGALWLLLGISGASATHAQALAQVSAAPSWGVTAAWALVAAIATLWLAYRQPELGLWVGLLALHSAWMFRWTVFLGGQGLSKTGSGYLAYSLPLGPDGLLGIMGTAGLWLALFVLLTAYLPWGRVAAGTQGA